MRVGGRWSPGRSQDALYKGLGFRVEASGFRVQGSRWFKGLGFRVQDGLRV